MTNKQEILAGPYARFYERFGDPTEELHAAYDSWLAEQAARPGAKLQPFEFDLDKYPEQSIYVPRVDARPAFPNLPDSLYYAIFKADRMRSLGAFTVGRLVNQMTPLARALNANQAEGKNTLVISSHINFQELGYLRAISHLAKKDRHMIHKSGALFNSLMTRQRYKGKSLVEHFTKAGHFYKSSPISDSAIKHGVPENASILTNALFKKILKEDLKIGGLELNAALTGSEVKPVKDDYEELSHYLIPEIHPSSAKLVEEFDNAVGMALVGPPILNSWNLHIGEVLDVQELLKTNDAAQVTDMIYDDLRVALERFIHKEVVYTQIAQLAGRSALSVDGHNSPPI